LPQGLGRLATIIAQGKPEAVSWEDWKNESREALEGLFGTRFHATHLKDKRKMIRVAPIREDEGIAFAGLLPEESAESGPYGGMSLVWFPITTEDGNGKSLLTFVCGTQGLAPDEEILGRPGHARSVQALGRALAPFVDARIWTKPDPANIRTLLPETTARRFSEFEGVFKKYGSLIYAMAEVPNEPEKAERVVSGFLDFYASERKWRALRAAAEEIETNLERLKKEIFPQVEEAEVEDLLFDRRFLIFQGPPGTGKTRMARKLLETRFKGHGKMVQFHPGVTYETFVAGIAPEAGTGSLAFSVRPGWMAEAIQQARENPEKHYLFILDEINRADLSRVLGEAILLFEPREIAEGNAPSADLPQPLPDGTKSLSIPKNFYVLGTMNTADRSIAILDWAVRRRFAFVDLWPNAKVIANQPDGAVADLATQVFVALQDLFVQFAPRDALVLLPGHAMFLADSLESLKKRLRHELVPLLREYLLEGRLGGCESEILAYLDWLESSLLSDADPA
jgi:5-methylcytosine-specific restriction protein B